MCLHVLCIVDILFGEKVRWRYACIQFFYVRLAGFTLYSIFFTFRGAFRESVDPRCCSSTLLQSLCTRAHFHFRSSPHFRRLSLLLSFSNEHFLFRLVSSHLKLPLSINQLPRATVPSHNICTFTHTPRRKVTASVVKHVFFLCHYCFVRSTRGARLF